jgi:hypothetical protein
MKFCSVDTVVAIPFPFLLACAERTSDAV